MKAFRYNSQKRTDRKFNQGAEKNPTNIKFYATNLKYADNYKNIYTEDGDFDYKCELETKEIDANLFDMTSGYSFLATYKSYINKEIGQQRNDYQMFLDNATKKADKKLWSESLAELDNRAEELTAYLVRTEFQTLSDYDMQISLVEEIKSLGFEGYKTVNEIAIF